MSVVNDVDGPKEQAQELLEGAASSRWVELSARAGLVARGLLSLVVGILAFHVARGHSGARADKQGALQSVVRQPFGRLLVLALAVGFAGYAIWRIVEAAVGPPGKDGGKAVVKRLGYVARAALYAFLCASALRLLIWSSAASDQRQPEVDWTARTLGWPGGTWLVQAVGLALIATGMYVGWRGLSGAFRKSLKSHEMGRSERRWIRGVGTVGMVARMVVWAMIGIVLIAAARQHDPQQAVGIDGALKRLADRSYGPWLLVGVAAGLTAYGFYSFAEARYRRVGGR